MVVRLSLLSSAGASRWLAVWLVWAACTHGSLRPSIAAATALGPLRDFTASELKRIVRVQPIVKRASAAHGVPVEVINGVIWVESKFQARARGRRGPRGLMQIMPRTGRSIARALRRRYRPQSVDFNIHAGAYYLSTMFARFGGNRLWGLAAYNHGPGVAKRWQQEGVAPPESSRRYAARVQRAGRAIAARLGG